MIRSIRIAIGAVRHLIGGSLCQKKHRRRRSGLEKSQHDIAVKVRKMTDKQLCEFLWEIESRHPEDNLVGEFLEQLEKQEVFTGIRRRTTEKLRSIARKMGYITEVR